MSTMIQEFADFSHKMTDCFGDLSEFESKIRQISDIIGINLSEFEIDHLAVRMNSNETAEQWRNLLLSEGQLLKESDVNGRPIALINLNNSIEFCAQQINIIELPFPKDKIYPIEGWEHVELVVPVQQNESVETWIERLFKRWNLVENLQIKIKISEPKVAGERLPNPSIAISLRDKNLNNFCTLKLHPYSIKEICQKD